VVKHTSRWWELMEAARQHRQPAPLFHAALELVDQGAGFVIEMAPAWGVPAAERGVVATGPVGSARLGRSRLFRYEVRCWPDGTIPDRQWSVGAPILLTEDQRIVHDILERVRQVPIRTWGRSVPPTGDMWNSNSLIAWLLAGVGISTELRPPDGGRAPGWDAGLALAMS